MIYDFFSFKDDKYVSWRCRDRDKDKMVEKLQN